jgi:hypothetical protein
VSPDPGGLLPESYPSDAPGDARGKRCRRSLVLTTAGPIKLSGCMSPRRSLTDVSPALFDGAGMRSNVRPPLAYGCSDCQLTVIAQVLLTVMPCALTVN